MKLALVDGARVWVKPLSDDAKAKASRERQQAQDAKKTKRRDKIKAAKKAQWVEQKYPPQSTLFYDSREWLELRYKALATYGAKCQCCGATRQSGVEIHVDHIKPRSLFPKLQLRLDNLQILCRPCNIGKSNTDETDWR